MADRFRFFRNDQQLSQFYLHGVSATGKSLGEGSYGSVVEIKYDGVLCAAKQIHEVLLQVGNVGWCEIVEKYQRECQVMAGLRHPNIAQFLGLCVLKGFYLPLLVMERLEMSVDDLLECAPNIPLLVKISILTDTSSGLVYLHSRAPPIVHGDLTARNVLLTASLTAKITDLGNSRMVTFKPGQIAKTQDKTLGTTVYMPPEALSESHRYGPSLDIFSFGHLALFTLNQVFPGELLSSTYPNHSNPDQLITRSEVERRQTFMAKLEITCGASHPVLLDLVRQSLHNTPKRRPSSQDLFTRLRAVKSEIQSMYGGSVLKQINVASVLYVKEMKDKDKKIQKLQVSKDKVEADNRELMAVIERIEIENRQQQKILQRLQTKLQRLEQENLDKQTELDRLQQENKDQQTELQKLELKNSDQQTELQKLQQENRHNQMALSKLESQLQNQQQLLSALSEQLEYEKSRGYKKIWHAVTYPLQLDWWRGPDMPVFMSDYIQSVEINGTVYVGGGGTDKDEDEYIVMAYCPQTSQWHSLPPYTTKMFAITTINSKLVLVGGRARNNSDSSELGEWQPDTNQWTRPFPPMTTPRWEPSVILYKHWLVVAGGGCHRDRLHSIELLDLSNMQWSTGPATPAPWRGMKSTRLEDTWYLMGGYCGDDRLGSPDVYKVSLEVLVSQSLSDSFSIWRKLPSLNCKCSCPLIIGGSLLAVGGWDMKNWKPVSTIQRFIPETNTWVQAGLLPHAVWNCMCFMTSDKLHVMGGWDGKTIQNKFFSTTY